MKQLVCGLALLVAVCEAVAQDAPSSNGLVAHWPLAGDARELTGKSAAATIHGSVDLKAVGPAAMIRGPGNWLEVTAADAPRLSKGDFTLAMWAQADATADVTPGDLLSQYDMTKRRGFHLTLKSNLGVTSNQANWRHLQFGIDDNRATDWKDCGRPGDSLFAFAMATHEGILYAGTCEPAAGASGRVYRHSPDGQWVDCGAPDKSNSVTALAVHDGALYAGTGKYRLAGSALPESENMTLGGGIFRYAGDRRWIACGTLPDTEAVGGLVVYRGRLYASSLYRPAGFFRYEGDDRWTDCGTPDGKRVESMTVHDGFLYAGSYDGGRVYRYDGQTWTDCGLLGDNTQTYSFTSYEGRLHVGTWPSGRVFRFEGIEQWTDCGRLGEEKEVMGMLVHNGRLIAGTLPLAEVYQYDGNDTWRRLARLDHTPDVTYRRAWTMAEQGGRTFCSTLPSGKVFAFSAGRQAVWEKSLSGDWHHVAAVRTGNRLTLFVDGNQVAETADGNTDEEPYNLDSDAPLRIGAGANGPFNGRLADVRVYQRSLEGEEIRRLATRSPRP